MANEEKIDHVPCLDRPRHIKYWTRCLKTLLPSQYTSNDSNRMYLGYFILSAMDLLNVLSTHTTDEERSGYINWIYHCQHPEGGFRMWSGTDLGGRTTRENAKWDPANVPATYFALASLLILGDDLGQVRRRETLRWLQKMQRGDGSFGETLIDNHIEGGRDPRFGYCAAGTRHILRGETRCPVYLHGTIVEDVDIDSLVECIQASKSYDGGIADESFHEPHAGYAFCSLGALALIGRLESGDYANSNQPKDPMDRTSTLRWLVDRQTDLLDPDGKLDSEFGSTPAPDQVSEVLKLHQSLEESSFWHSDVDLAPHQVTISGMNGRTNKVADTCYGWWVAASLHILKHGGLFDQPALREYLLKRTQHPFMGGFCKFPGDNYADVYHSFMGLAALSLSSTVEQRRKDGIKDWDAEMCVSKEVRERLKPVWAKYDKAQDASI